SLSRPEDPRDRRGNQRGAAHGDREAARLVRKALLAGALLALVLPTVAHAHVTVLPAFLEDGQRSTLTFTAPNERPPHSVTQLTLTFPAGFELTADPAPAAWRLAVAPGNAVWSGGATRPREIFCSGSSSISFHWAIQPGSRPSAKSTVK